MTILKFIRIIIGFLALLFMPSLIAMFGDSIEKIYELGFYNAIKYDWETIFYAKFLMLIAGIPVLIFGIPIFIFLYLKKYNNYYIYLALGFTGVFFAPVLFGIINIYIFLVGALFGMFSTSIFWLIAVKNND